MRNVRVSSLLVAASCWWGCAQGSADHAVASSRHNAGGVVDPRPEVLVRDAGASSGDPFVEDDVGDDVGDDLADDVAVRPDAEPEPSDDDEELEPPLVDAAVIDPVTDASLPAPPLTAPPNACIPGAYVGTFRGELHELNGVVRTDVAGTVRFELPATETPTMVLNAGTLEGTDAEGHAVKATIAGTLACETGVVQATIGGGTYVRPDPVLRVTTTARFTGTLSGSFRAGERPTGSGNWTVESERKTRGGSGSFEVQLAE